MNRRKFLGSVVAAGAIRGAHSLLGAAGPDTHNAARIKRVLVMFKCHFDLGFVDTQAAIVRRYFDVFYPQAITIAETIRREGNDRYIWTTGSWLLYEYLEQAKPEERKRMETAVAAGDIAWHALPFNWQTELLDPSMIEGLIGLSKTLDKRFGRTTTGAKMTDVPGHSRGLVGPLVQHGVKLLDIGVNSASTPPQVPSLFNWKDPAGNSLVMMYHQKEYGGIVEVPESDLAVDIEVRNDNSGPHPLKQVHEIYAILRKAYPNAEVKAANLSDIAEAVVPYRSHFPVVTQEIGDTWIYGVPSDPIKVAEYRELARLRQQWIGAGAFRIGDKTDLDFLSKVGLAAEHTWGTDTKTWLDFDHYRPRDLATMLNDRKYRVVEGSWVEKRQNLKDGIAALPEQLRSAAEQAMRELAAKQPDTAGLREHSAGEALDGKHYVIELDQTTGAIRHLQSKSSGKTWASPERMLALFTYQTLSKQDYDKFLASYITVQTDWAPKDFGKPNIEKFGAQSRDWHPKLVQCWSKQDTNGTGLVARLAIEDSAAQQSGTVAWPGEMFLEIWLPNDSPTVEISFSCFDKIANRLPEALWLSFQPDAPDAKAWRMEKVGQWMSPFDVVAGGNRHMHALTGKLEYRDGTNSLTIESIDAPVVSFGERSPIYFSNAEPDLRNGINFCLFNNGWGTNYVQWFGEPFRSRFVIRAS